VVSVVPVVYTRVRHATHGAYGASGWDLDQWDVTSPERPHVARVGTDVPSDAEYHSGYVDREGRQHWIYIRCAPMSPEPCPRCEDVGTRS
jgi:hypothetical protein